MTEEYKGRLELTWTNKHLALLADEEGRYEWLDPSDYRVAEVRLLHDAGTVGDVTTKRARDNLLVRGDALNALTSLSKLPEFSRELVGKVRLIYVDPPFNTKQLFPQYDDALEHSVWLTMMRDRLDQLKDFLAPNGSIWVHLDDSEDSYCRVLLDELFKRDRRVGTVIWRAADSSNNDAKQFSMDHNTLLVYAPDPEWRSNLLDRTEESNAHYSNPDNDPEGDWFSGNLQSPKPRKNLMYTVLSPTGYEIPHPTNGWRWKKETLEEKIDAGEIIFTEDGKGLLRKTYLANQKGLPPSSLWGDIDDTGHNRQAKYELKKLFKKPTADLFATPKPERLLRKILAVSTDPGDIVLDCFLGSGTTAAVAQKMGRRWVGIEWSRPTLEEFAIPRMRRVISGEDQGGISKEQGWKGGGGFRILDVAPSMFTEDAGTVVLSEWAVNGALCEATAAQLEYEYEVDPPFCGRKGRARLAVIDGLVNGNVVTLLACALPEDERLIVCGTAIDPACREILRALRPGSTVRKIPSSILAEYRRSRLWDSFVDVVEPEPEPEPVGA